SSPSMSAASFVAVARVQRMVGMPHRAPAIPTIAGWAPGGAAVGGGFRVSRTLGLILKTSRGGHSLMGFPFGENGTVTGVRDWVIDFTAHLRGVARRVP